MKYVIALNVQVVVEAPTALAAERIAFEQGDALKKLGTVTAATYVRETM